jgi:hypothetical protein
VANLVNISVVLSRLVQPPRALMPTLLAKYNVTFLDAIGRAPRILPYEYFKSIRVGRPVIRSGHENANTFILDPTSFHQRRIQKSPGSLMG